MPDPMVDVILPTNRLLNYLPLTIDTVVAQTWTNWRLTIVNDGGPVRGALERLVEGLSNAQVINQPARGLSAARNRGLAATSAPLVVFLDDDDLWETDRLSVQVQALQDAPHCVGAFSGGSYIDQDGKPFGPPWPAKPTFSRNFLSGEVPLPRIVTMMVRRVACDAIGGFDERIELCEDHDFTLRLLQIGEMVASPQALTRYRRHTTNVSQPRARAQQNRIHLMLDNQIREAELREDVAAAILLKNNRKTVDERWADDAIAALHRSLRDRDAGRLGDELGWAMRAPLPVLLAALRRLQSDRQNGRNLA